VRRGASDELEQRVGKLAAGDKAAGVVTREQFAAAHGADPAHMLR